MDGASHRRRSKVWSSLIPNRESDEEVVCGICNSVLSRIAEEQGKKCTTTQLWEHINQSHPEVAQMLAGMSQEDVIKEGVLNGWNLGMLERQTNKAFTSKVWRYFDLDKTNKSVAVCCECNARISRGCDRNTTSMWNHVKLKHPELYSSTQTRNDDIRGTQSNDDLPQKEAVRDEFLLHNARQNSYICKTCGMIMRLESPDERANTDRLVKHLDNIFHKRVQHGLEPPKRPILPMCYGSKAIKKIQVEHKVSNTLKKLPSPVTSESIVANREVDMVHSAIMMRTLYEQQKRDLCCDCTILIPHKEDAKQENQTRTAVRGDDDTIKYYETTSGYEFKVHACTLAIASDKMKTLLENSDAKTMMIHNVTKEAMLGFIEIIYLGKLKRIASTSEIDLWQMYLAAQTFNSTLAAKYLERECPHVIDKYATSEVPGEHSFGKFSILLHQDLSTNSITDEANKIPVTEDNFVPPISYGNSADQPTGIALLDIPDLKPSRSSRRKRRQNISSKIRLRSPVKRKKSNRNITELQDEKETEGADHTFNDEVPPHSGLKFEIQGDTAILRGSPDHFMENGDGFSNSPTAEEEAQI